MYDSNRDDTIPRATEVLGHFKRNITADALNRLRDAFKAGWKSPVKITNPLDFEIKVDFGRSLPDDARKAVESELAHHGWANHIFTTHVVDGVAADQLLVKLDHTEACKYA
jgi:hypothetical protein